MISPKNSVKFSDHFCTRKSQKSLESMQRQNHYIFPVSSHSRLPSTWFSKMLFCWLTHRLYRAQCVWRSSWAHPLWAGSPISLAADASPSSKLFASCPSLVQTPASHGPDQMLTLVQTPPSCSSERMSILSAAAFTHVYSRFSNHYFRADLLLHM